MPSTRSLLRTIQRFVEPTHKIRARGICKTLGLNAVDYLSESTMQERILHIKLVNGAVLRESQRENHSNCRWLNHRTEGLIIINTGSLCKTPENPASLIAIKREPSASNL
jgi:hypothetical protein